MIWERLRRTFNMSNDIAIDLGTANTLIYIKNQGIVLNEPSVVAIKRQNNKIIIVAIGNTAKEMIGRTPEGIEAIRPMKDGVIADFEIAEKMIECFLKKVINKGFFKPRVLVCVPSGATLVERRAIQEAVDGAGAKEVFLIEEPMAAAIGAGINIDQARGSMIVDIGGGTTEIAIISLGGIVKSSSLKIGGDKMDLDIAQYVRNHFKLSIGPNTAEKIKKQTASSESLCATKKDNEKSDLNEDKLQKLNKTKQLNDNSNENNLQKQPLKKNSVKTVELTNSQNTKLTTKDNINNELNINNKVADTSLKISAGGRYLISGIPNQIQISEKQVLESINDTISEIIFGIRKILEVTPAELSSDICETGIVLTGGGAMIKGIDKKISEEINLKVRVAESPLNCVVLGTGKALEELDIEEKYIKR